MTGLLLNSLSFPRKAGIQSNRARGLPTFFMGLSSMRVPPFSSKRGRWPKAGWGAESRNGTDASSR